MISTRIARISRARSSRRWSASAIRPSSPDRALWLAAEEAEDSGEAMTRCRGAGAASGSVCARGRGRGGGSRRCWAGRPRRGAARRLALLLGLLCPCVVVVVIRPLVSALKMRSARPLPRASSGSFLAPKSSTMTRMMMMILVGPRPAMRRNAHGCPLALVVGRAPSYARRLTADVATGSIGLRRSAASAPRRPSAPSSQVVRLDDGRTAPSRSISRTSHAGRPPGAAPRARRLGARSATRPGSTPPPSAPAVQPQGGRQVVGRGLEDPVGEVARRARRRAGDRRVEHLGRGDPVQPEQPLVLGQVAPGVEVGVPSAADQRERVDHALGGLVARGHVVVEPDLAAAADRLAQPLAQLGVSRPAGAAAAGRPGRPGGAVAGGGLELAQRPVDDRAVRRGAALAHRAERDDSADASELSSRSGRRR